MEKCAIILSLNHDQNSIMDVDSLCRGLVGKGHAVDGVQFGCKDNNIISKLCDYWKFFRTFADVSKRDMND